MCRTGICRFGIGNWIFLVTCLLFTFVQGGDDQLDPGVSLTCEPSDTVAVEGEVVTLPCCASSRHPIRISWRHSNAAQPTREHSLSTGDKYRRQMSNGSLVIENMSAALSGQYQCVATVDGIGTIVSRVATVFIAELPTLTPGPRSVLGTLGGTALLTCTMQPKEPRVALKVQPLANTPPDRRVYGATRLHSAPPTLRLNVTWLKNGSPLRLETGRMTVSASGALELDALRHHDAGSYACQVALAQRLHTHITSSGTELVVSEAAGAESPPRFIATPHPLTVMEGASATFDCVAAGNPKPEITWLNNGIAIDLSDLDSRFYLAGSGSLRVQSARALDAGTYTCRAHNRLDSADFGTQLHVLTPPRVSLPSGPVVVAHTRGDVTLRCEVRGRPQPTVTWLKDGEPLTPNNHDIAIVDGSSLRIQGVLRMDGGMFSCAARSPAGTAVGAARLLVKPPNDEPPNHHDILKTLISTDFQDTTDNLDHSDFLGETSSAYTSIPDIFFHATQDLDLDELKTNGTLVSPPKNLRAVLVKHWFVTLAWEAPDKGEDLTGYAIVYRVKGSDRERVSRSSAQRHELNVPSLPNTTYLFKVLAYTADALSPPTETIEVTTPIEELSHGPPQNVRAEPVGPHALRVLWQAPRGPAPAPTKYRLYCTEVESNREQVQLVEDSLTATISGLRAASLYGVRVAAEGGAASDVLRARTPSDAPAAPPANVSATPTGPTTILVRWEAPPARSHRGTLTGYKLRYRALSTPGAAAGTPRRKADSLTTPADARKAELRQLDTATTYQIRVCAINANGSGPFSEWVTASTQQQQLDESKVPVKPPPLTTRAGRDWISVWWSDEGGTDDVLIRNYLLGWGLGVPDEHSRQLEPVHHSHVIRGLEPNSEYVISLRASNSLGPGPPVYATVRTKPPASEGDDADDIDDENDDEDADDDEEEAPPLIPPVGLKAIMLSGTTAVVYWTDPTLSKGQAVTDGRRYVVRWAAAGGRPKTFNATDLNCMLDDLRPFTTYEFAVKLIKGGRESPWSMLASNTSLEAAPASPPRDLRVAPAAPPARAADVSWAPPLRPHGRLTGHVVMYAAQRAGQPDEWTAVAVPGDRNRARVDRLRPRTTYLFKVQAKNSKGLGPFSPPVTYTTALESGEGGGLAGATSAWLWASAGGACAVLALAAALALSLCCRRPTPPLSPDTSTYQKSSASAAIKPPDLWIHHDQMELKHMDKSLHSSASKISAGSAEGSALVASTLTLGRANADYEPARHAPPPASLDRRHYVPTYVESRRSPSCAGSSDETAPRSSPQAYDRYRCDRCDYKPMTGVGVGVGMGGVGCASTCERRQHRLPHPDQSTPLLAGVGSPQSSLASLHPPHQQPAPCVSGACPLGASCAPAATPGADIYACAARERGHYVAYEPLGHYTHRDSLSSEAGGGLGPMGGMGGSLGGPGGSLQRGARGACAPPGVGGLHSFTLPDAASDHSTPSHSRGSVRETSPYKKSASSSPGHLPNRLQLGGSVPHCAEELEPLTPSRSTERLHREMQNLEGLMKDLSAITQQQFHC